MNNEEKSEFESIIPEPDFTFNIATAFLAMIIMAVCLNVVGSIVSLPSLYIPDFDVISTPLGFALGCILAITILIHWKNIRFESIIKDLTRIPSVLVLSLSILIYFLFLPIAEYSMSLVPVEIEGVPAFRELYDLMNRELEKLANKKVSGFLTICLIAPLFEEIIFRGIILKGLLNSQINPWAAIIFSSFLFGLAHMNPWQFIGAGILGIIFAYIYYRTKSLFLCVFLHALNNTISYTLLIVTKDAETSVTGSDNYIWVFATITGIGVAYLLYNKTRELWKSY